MDPALEDTAAIPGKNTFEFSSRQLNDDRSSDKSLISG